MYDSLFDQMVNDGFGRGLLFYNSLIISGQDWSY